MSSAATALNVGAPATMSLLMPVRFSMNEEIRICGFTSVLHSRTYSPFSTSIRPISVMRSMLAAAPVVSRSSRTSGRSSIALLNLFAGRWGGVGRARTCTHERAEFEQARAQAISAGLDAVDHAIAHHHVEDAMRG